MSSLRPPAWITGRDTLCFLLSIPGARVPCEARYIALGGSNTIPVWVNDTIGSALPEFCVVLPSGEVLDLQQYDDNIPVPTEAPQDNWACVSAMFVVQFEEPAVKRLRTKE